MRRSQATTHPPIPLTRLCLVLAMFAVLGGCAAVGQQPGSTNGVPVDQWWVDQCCEPNHEVRPLPSDAPPALVGRDEAITRAHDYVQFEGEPTAVAHGLTEVTPGVWKTAWVVVEWYPNPSPHEISGPCCSPHYAVTWSAGVALSDQTGELLVGWQQGRGRAPASPYPASTTAPSVSSTNSPGASVGGAVTPVAATSPTPSVSPRGSPAGPTPPASNAGEITACTIDKLGISLTNSFVAAGTVGGWVRFENKSGDPCSVKGWPTLIGVTQSNLTADAKDVTQQLGVPAHADADTIQLDSGDSSYAEYAGSDTPVGTLARQPAPVAMVPVRSSLDELLRVMDTLQAASIPWSVGVDKRGDLVTVTVPVLDQAAADALEPYADQIVLTTTVVGSP